MLGLLPKAAVVRCHLTQLCDLPLTDSRDEGPFILTHLYLLLGCAIPVWLSGPGVQEVGDPAFGANIYGILPHAGLISLGVGDAVVRNSTRARVTPALLRYNSAHLRAFVTGRLRWLDVWRHSMVGYTQDTGWDLLCRRCHAGLCGDAAATAGPSLPRM